MNKKELRDILSATFNVSELRDLCFRLGIVDEDIPRERRSDMARELVLYCERHGRLAELEKACRELRPHAFDTTGREQETGEPRPTIGIITALPKEYAAMQVLLENPRDYIARGLAAGRRYLLAEIPKLQGGQHSVVLSLADMGNNMAASRATLLLTHFPSVKSIIMVGIAGGIPNLDKPSDHIRLGDIVVSDRGGVVQYDFVKETRKGKKRRAIIEYRIPPQPPSAVLLEGVRLMQAHEIEGHCPWLKYIERACSRLNVARPPEESDILVSTDDPAVKMPHPVDPQRIGRQPRVFTGSIASANTLLKNASKRDHLRNEFHAKAVEMEGSGIADATWTHEVGYLVVRGICDYCDSNKGDDWQAYAAVVAAAYTRALLESIP